MYQAQFSPFRSVAFLRCENLAGDEARPGLAALDNLADKFAAGWLLPSKVLDLSYPTPFSFCNTKR